MNGRTKEPTREEVLDSFAVEPSHSRETLEQYLRDFPNFSNELIDLSRELGRIYKNDEKPMSAQDQRLIDAAWQQHMSFETKSLKDPLADLSVSRLREIALQLDVPRQVVTAFRERRVSVESVPRRFLARLAEELNSTLDLLIAALTIPTVPSLARSYKADGKPSVESAVSFERLLIDAGVDEDIVRLFRFRIYHAESVSETFRGVGTGVERFWLLMNSGYILLTSAIFLIISGSYTNDPTCPLLPHRNCSMLFITIFFVLATARNCIDYFTLFNVFFPVKPTGENGAQQYNAILQNCINAKQTAFGGFTWPELTGFLFVIAASYNLFEITKLYDLGKWSKLCDLAAP